VLFCASRAVTVTLETAGAAPPVTPVTAREAAGPVTKETVAGALAAPNVAVNTPEGLVVPEAGVNVLLLPVLLRLTACPPITFPCASFAVAVSVEVVVPFAVTELGEATRVQLGLLG